MSQTPGGIELARTGRGLAAMVLRRVMPPALIGVALIWAGVFYTEREKLTSRFQTSLSETLETSSQLLSFQIAGSIVSARSAAKNAIAVSALIGQDIERVVGPFLRSIVIGQGRVKAAVIVDFSGEVIVKTGADTSWLTHPRVQRWLREGLRGTETVRILGDKVYFVLPILLGGAPEGAMVLTVSRDGLIASLSLTQESDGPKFFLIPQEELKFWPSGNSEENGHLIGVVTNVVSTAPHLIVVATESRPMPSPFKDPVQAFFAGVFLLVLGLVVLGIWFAVKLITRPIRRLIGGLERHGLSVGQLGAEAPREIRTLSEKFSEAGREVEEALRQEKELSAQQRQFVSMVSHEFRTPLSIIDASARSLLKRRSRMSDADIDLKLEKTRASVRRLIRLMESTLNASKLEARTISLNRTTINLGAMIQEIVDDLRLSKSNVTIECDLAEAPDQIVADETLLYSVIDNLISNAIKYSPETPLVRISCGARDGLASISVTDNGVGIPPDEVERIGTRYFRASTSTGIAGTGIGLNLVRSVITLHGGKMSLTSELGVGSTFTVHLPLSTPPQHAENSVLTGQSDGEAGPLTCLAYLSKVSRQMEPGEMDVLLHRAEANNQRLGITGCVVFHDQHFLQIMEGEVSKVKALLARIKEDDRHQDLKLLFEMCASQRRFVSMPMRFLTLPDLMTRDPKLFETLGNAVEMVGARSIAEAIRLVGEQGVEQPRVA
ncbi:MAG: ATP-binding protein [Pseudomonadota bacterium]